VRRQEAGYVAGLPEVSQQACEVTQCRSALFLVFQPGRRGGGLAAVLLVHTHRKIAVSKIVPVVAPYRQHGKTGDVEQFSLRYRQLAGGGEPQAGGLVGRHRVRAVGLEYPRGGRVPYGSCQVPSAARAEERLALEAGQRPTGPGSSRTGTRASTWILKPDGPHSMAANEATCLRLAATCELAVPEAELLDVAGLPVLAVRRYDRHDPC